MDSHDNTDQAATLRKMTSGDNSESDARKPRVISVTSGKGGVGKTSVVANLAYLYSKEGLNVFVMDADIGLANMDVMLGLTPEYNLQHVLTGEKRLREIIVEGPGGMKILPASSGVQELAELNQDQKLFLLNEFNSLTDVIDLFLIDTGAGISTNVMYFNMAAQEIIVVMTPEPTSITDAYAIMKVMSKKYSVNSFKLIVNETKGEAEAQSLFDNLSTVAGQFLNISIEYIGCIVMDTKLPMAVKNQKLITVMYPESEASLCFLKLAKKLQQCKPDVLPSGNIGFFWTSLLENTI